MRGKPRKFYPYKGKMMSLLDIEALTGIKSATLKARTSHGKTMAKAISLGMPVPRGPGGAKKKVVVKEKTEEVETATADVKFNILRKAIEKGLVYCPSMGKAVFSALDCTIMDCTGNCFDGLNA